MKIGVLGAGQLAQMLAQAGLKLGHEFMFLCPDPDSCAAPYGELLCADYHDDAALAKLRDWADVITYEFENVPNEVAQALEAGNTLYPPSMMLGITSDRITEKNWVRDQGIGTADFAEVRSFEDLVEGAKTVGLPAILKTSQSGYDGKGQVRIASAEQLESAWEAVGQQVCVLEGMVPFNREVSMIAARSPNGDIAYLPLSENAHTDGILHIAESKQNDPVEAKAQQMIKALLDASHYVGVLTVEFFDVDGELLVNELAPRVHNSGHWSIEACDDSQFSLHIKAIAGESIHSPKLNSRAAMVNVIGQVPQGLEAFASDDTFVHLYGKAPRSKRKIGHVTVLESTDAATFNERLAQLVNAIEWA